MVLPLRDTDEWRWVSRRAHGRVLVGKFCHWCNEWDGLPVDETVPEWEACVCFDKDQHEFAAQAASK